MDPGGYLNINLLRILINVYLYVFISILFDKTEQT